ncbi:hypothetical protein Tco_0525032 [Tanacetum coccineum]
MDDASSLGANGPKEGSSSQSSIAKASIVEDINFVSTKNSLEALKDSNNSFEANESNKQTSSERTEDLIIAPWETLCPKRVSLGRFLPHARSLRFKSLRGGFPSRWEFLGFCPIDASIRDWQGLPSGCDNLALASSVSQINPCQGNDTIPQSFEDIGKPPSENGPSYPKPTNNAAFAAPTAVPPRVNNVFLEQFLTERPGSSDVDDTCSNIKSTTPSNEQDDRSSMRLNVICRCLT